MASEITGNSNVWSTTCSGWHQSNIKALHYLAFSEGNHQWLVDSPHKGPVMWIVLSCHDVMMDPHHSHFPNKNLHHIDGLVQDCSNSSALAMELLQSCTKLSIYSAMYLCISGLSELFFFIWQHHMSHWVKSDIFGIIKSTQYTGDDFMFLCGVVHRWHRHRPQILVYAINFEQLFRFLSFLARLLALTCRLPD